jgi:hypothetical protein
MTTESATANGQPTGATSDVTDDAEMGQAVHGL